MNIKIHKDGDQEVVALCDKNLIGKKLEEGDLALDLNARFYDGEDLSEKEVIEILKFSGNINIVGVRSIRIAIKAGIIDKGNVRKIDKVPYAIVAGI